MKVPPASALLVLTLLGTQLTGQVSYGGIVAKRRSERGNFLRLRVAQLF